MKTPPSRRKQPLPERPPVKKALRGFVVGEGVPSIPAMHQELLDMTDCLLGRTPPPIDVGVLTLMEVADGFFARASEMSMNLLAMEREGRVAKGSSHQRFRTGELRTFIEMAHRAAQLGSRRVTARQLQIDAERTGRGKPTTLGHYGDDDDDD